MLHRRFLLLSASSVLAFGALAGSASAQTAPASAPAAAPDNAEIIVTATKRDARLIDVPAAVTALNGEELRDSGALRIEDYQARIPGLSLTQIAPGYTQFNVRGVTTGAAQLSSTVATYFDESPTNSSTATALGSKLTPDPDLFDIERVEVLRGPQGTLYGANALGGVVRYILAKPDLNEAHGQIQAGVMGVTHGEIGYLARGAVSVPLIAGQLGVRASGFYTRDPGYIDNVATGRDDINRSVNKGGRIALDFKPSDNFTASLSSLYQRRQTDGSGAETVDMDTLAPSVGGYLNAAATDSLVRTEYQLHSLAMSLDLGGATVSSATSFGRQKSVLISDLSGLAGGLATTTANNDVKKFTQELRIASPAGAFFDYIIGGFYTHERAAYVQTATLFLAPGVPAPAPFNPLLVGAVDSTYEEVAAFANVTLNLSDQLNIQAGGRWSHNTQTFSEDISGALFGPAATFDGRSSEDAWTFTVGPQFKITPDLVVYARVAKGFRPGGTNLVLSAASGVSPTYGSDSLVNYEAGIKASLFDRRLSMDLAAYRIDWSDIQTTGTFAGFNYLFNGGRARSKGVEASARWSADGLTIAGNLAYNDAVTRDDMVAVGAVAGDRLPYSPRWTGSINADYEFALGGTLMGSVGAGLRHSSSRNAYYSATVPASITLPAYQIFDIRAGLRSGQYALSVFVQNLTDERGILLADTSNANPLTAEGTSAVISRPRTVGVTLSAGF